MLSRLKGRTCLGVFRNPVLDFTHCYKYQTPSAPQNTKGVEQVLLRGVMDVTQPSIHSSFTSSSRKSSGADELPRVSLILRGGCIIKAECDTETCIPLSSRSLKSEVAAAQASAIRVQILQHSEHVLLAVVIEVASVRSLRFGEGFRDLGKE